VADRLRILLPGAGGFLGRHIHEALAAAGHRVTGLTRADADLGDPVAVARAIAAARPEVVVNAAGISSPRACREDPAACFTANTAAAFNLLEGIRTEAPGGRLVALSSAAVYGPGGGEPLTEDDAIAPHSVYGASKLAAEVLGGQYIRSGSGRVTTLRVFNLVGPGQPADQAAAEFAREVRAALDRGGREATLTVGDPAISRDFTDVRDAAAAVALTIAAPETANRILNLCSGRTASLGELAEALARLARREGEPPFTVRTGTDPARTSPGDPHTVCGSPVRLKQATGWEPVIPLEQSLGDLFRETADGDNRNR